MNPVETYNDFIVCVNRQPMMISHMATKERRKIEWAKRIEEKTGKEPKEFAEEIISGKSSLNDTEIKSVFRLNPPSKGFKSTKRHYPDGSLGYRGEEINKLLSRMI